MAGKFVIKKGTTGKFRFSLLARNGQGVATSEAYGSKAAAMWTAYPRGMPRSLR